MLKEHLYGAYSISFVTMTEDPKSEHSHSFFELIYIVSGTGDQWINGSKFPYQSGHMFLITPEDKHAFDILSETTFCYLRFNNIYINDHSLQEEYVGKLEYILQNANHRPGCILRNLPDKLIVKPLIDALMREQENDELSRKELIRQYVNTLILIVARNIMKFQGLSLSEYSEGRVTGILEFIQTHIFYPEKLRADYLGERFNMSPAYLGKYFRKHTGQTMQEYIKQYKLQLIEHRLQYSDKRMNEIVHEFNFTDESHFTRFFKKNKGLSPKAFRETVRKRIKRPAIQKIS